MTQGSVELSISFETLLETVSKLNFDNKRLLWELLDEQLAQAEEELWEQDPAFRAELEEARAAYERGEYMTIDEYAAQQKKAR